MNHSKTILPSLLFLALPRAFGQGGPTLVGAGNGLSPGIAIAPGQVTTFWLAGMSVIASVPVHAALPLPTTLANVSVTIKQVLRAYSATFAVPILSIDQTNGCDENYPGTGPDCLITGITVVIPADLGTDPYYFQMDTVVVVSQSGVDSKSFGVNAVPDMIHVLTNCGAGFSVCVTHADGTLLADGPPATAGEVVVIYATGLGAMNGIFANFDFHPNAGPSRPVDAKPVSLGGSAVQPLYVGQTFGQIGLYQINLKLPDSFPSAPACGGTVFNPLLSNLTITIASSPVGLSSGSFDGAPICIQPPQ
jgi:hypothetical protein